MTFGGVLLLVAMVLTGLTAGFLFAFAHTVMPGLSGEDDRDYLRGFARLDAVVTNGWMLASFVGAPLVTAVALLVQVRSDGPARWWVAAALLLSVATIAVTRVVHLPLNAEVSRAAPQFVEATTLRATFEARWVSWNWVRTATSTAATTCLGVALWLVGGGR